MADHERIGLDTLSPAAGSKSSRKRVGRGHGSGSGKTSGRGHKGQKSRSGASIPAWFEGGQMPLYRRTPKRGFRPLNRVEFAVVNVGDLDRFDGDAADPDALREQGLVGGSSSKPVKVLGRGEIERALQITAHAFSASAREKIEAAGGSARVLE